MALFVCSNTFAITLSEFKDSLNKMVARGLLTDKEAKQHLVEYQFKLENSKDKISERLVKRSPANFETIKKN